MVWGCQRTLIAFFFGTGDGVKSRVSWGCLLGRKGGGGWVTGKSRLSVICFN